MRGESGQNADIVNWYVCGKVKSNGKFDYSTSRPVLNNEKCRAGEKRHIDANTYNRPTNLGVSGKSLKLSNYSLDNARIIFL